MRDLVAAELPPALAPAYAQWEQTHLKLIHLTRGMSDAELAYTGPTGNINSTAMLLAHLNWVEMEYLHLIMGRAVPPELEAAFGPPEGENGTLPAVTGKTLADLLDAHAGVLAMGREYLRTLTDADAVRSVSVPWWPEPGSVRFVLWHMAGHSLFHQGQIARLRAWYRG